MTENCVPACLACNGHKGDQDAFVWYRAQPFYDPRRAMALRAWTEGDMKVALHLLAWSRRDDRPQRPVEPHQTRQAASPLWRWQMAS